MPVFSRPAVSLAVLGGLCAFAPLIEGGTTHLPVFITRFTVLALFVGWILASMKAGTITIQRNRLFPVIAVFLFWAACSAIRAPYAAPALQWLISLGCYAALFFLVLHLVDSLDQVWALVAVALVMGALEAVLGIYQVVVRDSSRATGTFFNPNFFAAYEVAVIAVALGLLGLVRGRDGRRWEQVAVALSAGLSFVGFLLSQSRGALVACVAAVMFVGCLRFGRVFLGILLLAVLLGALFPNPMRQRLMTVEAVDPYAYTRVDIWRNALQRIADHPLGAGLGMYRYTSFQYRFPVEGTIARYAKRAESAHNEYLQIGADLGVVGLAVFLAGIWILGAEWHGTLNARLDAGERGLVIGLAGGIMGLLVHAAVDSVFHQPALVLLLVLFAGMIGVVKRVRTSAGASTWAVPFPHRPTRVVLVGALAVLLAFLIIRPAAAWYAFDKGAAEMRDGRADQALDWYQLATQIDPGTVSYHDAVALTEATLYQQSGELRRLLPAIEELKVGLDLNPLDGRLANRLGTLYGLLANRLPSGEQQATMVEHAGTYYEQAIRLDPYSPFNYLELAKIRSRQGRESEADAWLKQAIQYEPNFLPARILRAELAVGRGRKDIAVSEYRESVKIAERYRGQPLDSLERRYLEADHDRLKRSLALAEAP